VSACDGRRVAYQWLKWLWRCLALSCHQPVGGSKPLYQHAVRWLMHRHLLLILMHEIQTSTVPLQLVMLTLTGTATPLQYTVYCL